MLLQTAVLRSFLLPKAANVDAALRRSGVAALEQSDLAAINRWLSITRFRAALSIAVAVPVIGFAGGVDLPILRIVLICAAVYSLSLVYSRCMDRGCDLRLLAYVQLIFDTLGIATGLAMLGHHHALFRGLFLMTIVPATMVSGTCGAVITALSSACYGTLLLQQGGEAALVEEGPWVLFLVSIFLYVIVGNQSFFYKRHLRDKNRDLAATGRRLEEANAELTATAEKALALLEVSHALDTSLDIGVATDRVHSVATEGLRTEWCATILVDPDVPCGFRLVASSGLANLRSASIDETFSEFGARVAAEGLVEITDVTNGPQQIGSVHDWGVSSGMFAAMRCGSRTVGIFATGYRSRTGRFTSFQRETMVEIATQTAIAIEVRTLHAKQREEAEISAALLRVTELLNVSLDTEGRFDNLTALTCSLAGSDFANVLLYDAKSGTFRFAAATDVRLPHLAEEARHLSLSVRDFPVLAQVVRGSWAERWEDGPTDGIPEPWLRHWSLRSILAAPLNLRGEVLGALVVGSHEHPGPYSPQVRRLLSGIACQTVTALENRRLIQNLRAANRLKSEFIGAMSHELRTPLNVIIGYTELLRDGDFGPIQDEQREICCRVRDAATQLLDLIQSTLDVNRLESGVLPTTLGPVDVRALINELAAQVPPGWVKSEVRLSFEVDAGIPEIKSDYQKLKTVVRNLVQNALKFTERGAVTVRACPAAGGAAVAITVSDTGVGISPENQAIIFDLFRQVDASDRRRHDGVGLGLYIVRQLTALLGGTIAVESEVGRGSQFRVCFPVKQIEASTASTLEVSVLSA